MDDAGRVRRGHAVGDLHGEVEHLARPLDRRQRAAVEELHDQVVRPDVVQLADVRMIQRRDGARFALEAVAEFGGRLLDRDEAIEPRVARFVHLAHPAGTERARDFIRTESDTWCKAHRLYLNPSSIQMSNGQSANDVYSRVPSGLMLSPATSSAVVGKSTVTTTRSAPDATLIAKSRNGRPGADVSRRNMSTSRPSREKMGRARPNGATG